MQASILDTQPVGVLPSLGQPRFPCLELLSDVGIIELLEQDKRPTFVIDLTDPCSFKPSPFQILFANAALWSSHSLVRLIFGPPNGELLQFKSWALSFVKHGRPTNVCLSSYMYCDIRWSCWTVRQRFRFVSGNVAVTPSSVAISNLALTSRYASTLNPRRQQQVENSEKQRRERFAEHQRHQQIFIDVALHELRNAVDPMSRCAETISSAVSKYQSVEDPTRGSKNHDLLLKSCTDAAQSITHWANYQKQIADDILVISKFDLNYLRVTPVDVHPIQIIQRLLKMFENIFMSNDIRYEFRVEDTYWDLGIDRVKADSQKLFQILINLITNAIERTHTRENRYISVSLSASKGMLEATEEANMSNISSQPSYQGALAPVDPRRGNGTEIYLHFSIRDTGQAIKENETDISSWRFPHCLPEMHTHPSIPDLRLFICDFLAELHGGQIHVEPESGGLSGFTSYIKAARSSS